MLFRNLFLYFLFSKNQDTAYQEELVIPSTGLNHKTKIYVEVKASNLTSKYVHFKQFIQSQSYQHKT